MRKISTMARGLAVLVVAALAAGLPAARPAQAATGSVGGEFDESVLEDGYDYLGVWSGDRWLFVTSLLGSLPGTSPLEPASTGGVGTMGAVGDISRTGLTLKKSVCLDFPAPVKGRHCFRKFRVNKDNDPRFDYILWWAHGSTAVRELPTILRGVKDTISTTSTNASLLDWRPGGTTEAGNCVTKNMSFGLSAYGFTATISQTFTVCPDRFGPDTVTSKVFKFRWDGGRAPNDWVGTVGGALFRVPPGGSGTYKVSTVAYWCEVFGTPEC